MNLIATGSVVLATLAAAPGSVGLATPLEEFEPRPLNTELESLRVGVTGIFCYQEPCPWNGVAPNATPVTPASLLWSGANAPPLAASPEDEARIRAAYSESCVVVEGRFVEGVLEVRSVTGDC